MSLIRLYLVFVQKQNFRWRHGLNPFPLGIHSHSLALILLFWGLIPCAYKIVARVLSNWLKQVLPFTIAPNQLAFVANRQILDASLMANELIDDWSSSQKSGIVLKLDLEKTFDMVDWEFLDTVLCIKGFSSLWCNWISGCFSSANYSIILNGCPHGKIIPSRGIR